MNGTLAELIADRCAIRVWCRSPTCKLKPETRLDPLALALKYGENADLQKLRRKLRCRACGARDVFWMPSWPDVPMGLGVYSPPRNGVW